MIFYKSSDAPRKIAHDLKFKTYMVGLEITCSADGNPPVNFLWKDINGKNVLYIFLA